MRKTGCAEVFQCNEISCPAYKSANQACWLISGTRCYQQIQGEFLDKIEMCLDCQFFNETIDISAIKETLLVVSAQLKQFSQLVGERDRELHAISMELSIGLSESFEALKKIASGDPLVKIPETSDVELIRKLKQLINLTAVEFGEMVDLSHEFAIGIAEQFDVLHRVSQGDLAARVSGFSKIELLETLKRIFNAMIESLEKTDIARKKIEKELLESEEKFRTISAAAKDAILMIDDEGNVLFWNQGAERIFGYSAKEIAGEKIHDVLVPFQYRSVLQEGFSKFKLTGQAPVFSDTFVMTALRKDKTEFPVSLSVSSVKLHDKWHAIGILRDITEQKRMEEELRSLSLHDELTGIYNRRGFITLAEQQLKIADRMKREMMMIYVDLDKMKYINDTFSHQEGDRALIDTANILRATFRPADIIARIGGDEFAIMALETGTAYSEIMVSRLKTNVDAHNSKSNRGYTLSFSVGLTPYDPAASCSMHELLARADASMYEQKRKKP